MGPYACGMSSILAAEASKFFDCVIDLQDPQAPTGPKLFVSPPGGNIPASNEDNECELATAEIVSRLVDKHGLDLKVIINLIIDGL